MTLHTQKTVSMELWYRGLCMSLLLWAALVVPVLTGCGSNLRSTVLHHAKVHGFSQQLYPTRLFTIYGLFRPGIANATKTLCVYIEGDGSAWRNHTQPSDNPTPYDPVGLRLAASDPGHGPILYLSRPCQFVTGNDLRNCTTRYWTSARLAPEVIDSLNEVINNVKKDCNAQQIALIGFSGGGGAAALLAVRRTDVSFLGTIAGNLDTTAWTQLHNVSLLSESLNPMEVASALQHVPQRHLSSIDDAIMPPIISENFCDAAQQPQACQVVRGVRHNGQWENLWSYRYDDN